jgi:hypothetical protein
MVSASTCHLIPDPNFTMYLGWLNSNKDLNLNLELLQKVGLSWSWSYGSWIYLCNQCLLPLKLYVWIPLMVRCTRTTLCDKVCQWLTAGQWFSPGTPVFSINKTDRHDIKVKVALDTITLFGIDESLMTLWFASLSGRTCP